MHAEAVELQDACRAVQALHSESPSFLLVELMLVQAVSDPHGLQVLQLGQRPPQQALSRAAAHSLLTLPLNLSLVADWLASQLSLGGLCPSPPAVQKSQVPQAHAQSRMNVADAPAKQVLTFAAAITGAGG